jgi:predicted phosphodiesterase
VRTFTPGPAEGSPFRHLGDHGTTAQSAATVAHLRERRPDLVLIAGDLSYANGTQPVWDRWFDLIEPFAATVPVMAAPGNHENEDGDAGAAFKHRLSQPGTGAYYAFDADIVAFVTSTAGVFVEDALIAEEQILQRHLVDLLLVGHDHFYERSKPMAYGQPVPAGGCVEVKSWSAAHADRLHVVLYDVQGDVMKAQAVATDVPGLPPVLAPRRPGLCKITVRGAAGE